MAASITFDFLSRGADKLAGDFKKTGDNAAVAAKGAKVLQDDDPEPRAARRTAPLRSRPAGRRRCGRPETPRTGPPPKALAADIAIRRLDDAMQDAAKNAGSARGGFAGLVGEVTGFGAASTAASGKSSLFARALAGINLASGVLEPALAGVVVAAGGLAAAFAAAGAGAAAYSVALKPLLSQTQDVMKAQETLDKARATAQANYEAAIKSGASAKTADAARTKAMTAAQDQYNIAVKGTPGPVREFAKSVTAAKNTYTGWADSLAKPVLAPLSGMLKLVKPALTAITPLVRVAAGAFGTLVSELSAKVNAGGLTSVVSTLLPHVRTTILDLGHAAGNVAAGIWGILKAFLPVSGQITGGVVKLTAKFKEWGQSLSGGTGFQSLMTTFKEETPQAVAILKNLGTVLGNVGKAMFGLSTFSNSKMLLNMLLPLSGLLATLSKNTALTRLALYLWAAHSAASKLIPAVQGVVGGIKLIGTALEFASANPIVLIAAAVIALGVAFYVAWQKSAGFRDVMKYIAQGFLGAGIIIVQVNKAIVSSFLSMVGTVLHAAATAFGWVPGLGDKLRGASRAFDGFKAGVDKTFDGVISKMRQWQDSLDKTRSTSHDAAVKMTADFTRQGAAASQARTDLGKYTEAIGKNRVNSDAAKAARASLIADLHKAGVNSTTARTDVDQVHHRRPGQRDKLRSGPRRADPAEQRHRHRVPQLPAGQDGTSTASARPSGCTAPRATRPAVPGSGCSRT